MLGRCSRAGSVGRGSTPHVRSLLGLVRGLEAEIREGLAQEVRRAVAGEGAVGWAAWMVADKH